MENNNSQAKDLDLPELFELLKKEDEERRGIKIKPVVCDAHFYSTWTSSESKFVPKQP